ncbi:MAG: GNAT family N-acetyltransferase [Flavobacteriaceae bacterium]|nr:GNAT family N-acetyltransferase [Flavobacteriaceae bacterium]
MNSDSILIRDAVIDDLSQLLEFEQKLIAYERDFDPNLKAGKIHYYDIKKYILDPEIKVVVAEHEQLVIGSGYGLIKSSVSYKNPETFVYLGFMYVEDDFRGRGVNHAIIQSIFDWGKEKGHDEFQLDVYSENESALLAYEKSGFKPYLQKMRIKRPLNNS